MNIFKTLTLLVSLTGMLLFIGTYLGGRNGMLLAFMISIIMNSASYWFSDKIILSIHRAKEIREFEKPELYHLVKNLTLIANLPMPKLYIIPEATPNAFATGRNEKHAVVAVTQGLLKILNKEELAGVLAHEISHIKDKDILISSIAATMAGAIMMIANITQWSIMAINNSNNHNNNDGRNTSMLGLAVMSIIAPIAATLIQMAISRSREYLADFEGAKISKNPLGLANALVKLTEASKLIPLNNLNLSTSHLWIVQPFHNDVIDLSNLFSTHPPVSKRIERLKKMI